MSCTLLRDGWCNIIVFNVHTPSEEKSDDSKGSFYEELEQVFDHFPQHHMKILMKNFTLIVGNESLHQEFSSDGVRTVNFTISKIWL
jgi:hypothetical protein